MVQGMYARHTHDFSYFRRATGRRQHPSHTHEYDDDWTSAVTRQTPPTALFWSAIGSAVGPGHTHILTRVGHIVCYVGVGGGWATMPLVQIECEVGDRKWRRQCD